MIYCNSPRFELHGNRVVISDIIKLKTTLSYVT
nr:MAG TPA: Ras-related protein Rab-8A, RILP-like protein trafficking, Rab GTPase, effector [Caudoviricetes sp.]